MNYLLDTNVLVDWFAKRNSFDEVSEFLSFEDAVACTSWICAAEFLVKATNRESGDFKKILSSGELDLMRDFDVELLDLVAEVRRETGLPLPDSIILATAKSNSLTLLTRDRDLVKRGKGFYSRVKQVG